MRATPLAPQQRGEATCRISMYLRSTLGTVDASSRWPRVDDAMYPDNYSGSRGSLPLWASGLGSLWARWNNAVIPERGRRRRVEDAELGLFLLPASLRVYAHCLSRSLPTYEVYGLHIPMRGLRCWSRQSLSAVAANRALRGVLLICSYPQPPLLFTAVDEAVTVGPLHLRTYIRIHTYFVRIRTYAGRLPVMRRLAQASRTRTRPGSTNKL